MAFGRPDRVPERPAPGDLIARMTGIGMAFAADADEDADIEATLVHASEVGMDDGDLRALSILTTWMGVHASLVNVDRLVRLVSTHPSARVRAYWAAVGRWLGKDRRYLRLARLHRGRPLDLLPVDTSFQLARRGEDERFAGSGIRVPRGILRDRPEDVLTPAALTRRHSGYRNRVRMGPTWRADVWTVLERGEELGVSELARRVGCSFATAWQVARDFALLRTASRETRRANGQSWWPVK